jgi:hypothetical protein
MLRLMTFVAGVLYLSGQALAATEADQAGLVNLLRRSKRLATMKVTL